ncbi:IclR family mhp operon transcriptional activator [Bradyrhizobium sp. S3.3.6]|uniref:DNA-binding transcriptional regulator n=1 Tax=Bradyrhizobium sp. S3.3.6 TaxID=3156429 RepID=UPI003398C257
MFRSTTQNAPKMHPKDDKVEAAARTLLLLEELNRHAVVSIEILHRATRLPKSTIVRLMKTLCAMGYATNDPRQGGYSVASRVKSLSTGFQGDPMVVEAARLWAISFTRQYRWPVAIAVLDDTSMLVRFSTIPDSPVSPSHSVINTRLSLLCRALGRSYIAFCSTEERSMLLDRLAESRRPEDALATDRKRALALLGSIRRQGFAERDPTVEPKSSNTIAVPIFEDGEVQATVGMTYFVSAVSQDDVQNRYIPLIKTLADNIGASVATLRKI